MPSTLGTDVMLDYYTTCLFCVVVICMSFLCLLLYENLSPPFCISGIYDNAFHREQMLKVSLVLNVHVSKITMLCSTCGILSLDVFLYYLVTCNTKTMAVVFRSCRGSTLLALE